VGVSAGRWVVFDLDGTLIESEQVWGDVRHAFTIAHGGRWSETAQSDMIGMRTAEWARYMHDALGVALAPDEIARAVVSGVVAALDPVPVLPGADAALDRLARTFRLGLATSAALPVARAVLARTGWADEFAVVVSADDVAHGKPAPDVYQRALALLGADAARSAAVEDSANGIRSAHAAGLAVIAIPNRAFPPDAAALALATTVLPGLDALDAPAVDAALANRA
jgi:beta-phosphoglucomutase-like phosphatase (HAD superfamily)